MKKHTRWAISGVLLVVLAVSSVNFFRQMAQRQQEADALAYAESLARGEAVKAPIFPVEIPTAIEEEDPTQPTQPKIYWTPAPVEDDPVMDELAQTDIAALRQENMDVVGWLCIPGTVINFPLMQGEDNAFYLEHTWNGTPNFYGSAFLECRNSADLTDFNTIIYGHNNRDGVMFAPLVNYTDETYFQNHPYIYIVTDGGVLRYEVFATYIAPVDSHTYGLSFNQQETRERFIAWALENSLIDSGITPGLHDRIITLSTCTGTGYDSRWVVQARLEMVPTYGT